MWTESRRSSLVRVVQPTNQIEVGLVDRSNLCRTHVTNCAVSLLDSKTNCTPLRLSDNNAQDLRRDFMNSEFASRSIFCFLSEGCVEIRCWNFG